MACCAFDARRSILRCPKRRQRRRRSGHNTLPCNFKHNPDDTLRMWLDLQRDLFQTFDICKDLHELFDYMSGYSTENDETNKLLSQQIHLDIEIEFSHKRIDALSMQHVAHSQQVFYSHEQVLELHAVGERVGARRAQAHEKLTQLNSACAQAGKRLARYQQEMNIAQTRTAALTEETGVLNKQVAASLPEIKFISLKLNDLHGDIVEHDERIRRDEHQSQLLQAEIQDELCNLQQENLELNKKSADLSKVRAECEGETRQIMDVHAQSEFVAQEKLLLHKRAETVQCDIDAALLALSQKVTLTGDNQQVIQAYATELAALYSELKERSELLRWATREMREHEAEAQNAKCKFDMACEQDSRALQHVQSVRAKIDSLVADSVQLQEQREFVEGELRKAQLLYIRVMDERKELQQHIDELRINRMASVAVYNNNNNTASCCYVNNY